MNTSRRLARPHRRLLEILAVLALCAGVARAQGPGTEGAVAPAVALGTTFTYQGQLRDVNGPVSGTCDLQFKLFDAAVGGTQVDATQERQAVAVANGLFTVGLSFGGGAFTGQARFLEI